MCPEPAGIHAELILKQGTIKQESYNVIKVHVCDLVCTLQMPSQQYELLREQGVDPFEFLSAVVARIGKRTELTVTNEDPT